MSIPPSPISLPPPPRLLDTSPLQFWREMLPHERAIAFLTFLPPLIITGITYQLLHGEQWSLHDILITFAIAAGWSLFLAFAWYITVRRIGKIRHLCRHGIAVRGILLSKSTSLSRHAVQYRATYLFEHPITHSPIQLEANVPRKRHDALRPGDPLTVLLNPAENKHVLVYEFTRAGIIGVNCTA